MSIAMITRTGLEVDAIDLFCGYGGSSAGIHAAGADVRVAANHNKLAIECHAANFPGTDHRRADLSDPDSGDYLDPADLPPARFLWASPSCKYHSQANAKKLYERGPQGVLFDEEDFDEAAYANSERSRVTMLCPLRYAARHRPELVAIENVVEAAKWGPGRDGSTFRWWLSEWSKLGYEHECLFLNSQFFPPCPQSRDRMYVVFWRRGNRRPDLDYRPKALCTSDRCSGAIVDAVQTWRQRTSAWPLARWGKWGAQYIYTCPGCRHEVVPVAWPAYSAIDWSNLGPRIAERPELGLHPLAESTIERIRRGVTKLAGGPPIVIPAKAVWGADRPVTSPFATQTSQQDKALVVEPAAGTGGARSGEGTACEQAGPTDLLGLCAFLVRNNGDTSEARFRSHAASEPLGTITAQPAQSLVTDGVVLPVAGNTFERAGQTRARALSEPLFTQHTTLAFGFAHTPFVAELRGGGSVAAGQRIVSEPASTITGGGLHHGLCSPALFTKINGGPGDTAWHHVSDPLNTICSRDTTGLVVLPWIEQYRSNPVAVTEQLATVMTHARHFLASLEPALQPVSDAELGEIRFRMLEPDPELRRAMAFDEDYILLGNKTQVTSGLGNAVTPPVARWLTARCLATLGGDQDPITYQLT